MARLTFVVNEPPDEPDVIELAPLARVEALAVRRPQPLAAHRPPTISGDPDCEPVRDVDGFIRHRILVVSPEEKTCLVCGETTLSDRCPTCGKGFDDAATPMVPTVSYLQPGEYEFTRSY
jgi:hypothetical protein